MKLLYYKPDKPNFGDDLNPWFWQRALGNSFSKIDGNDDSLILGIGTLINDFLPKNRPIHILGSGAGYGTKIPSKSEYWKVHFVRGPLSAEAIQVDKSNAISDPAILLYEWIEKKSKKEHNVSFMPHYAIDSLKLRSAVESAGLFYISPSAKRDEIIDQVNSSERLVTSAMHGTILAEALRVPWHPVITSRDILPFKWKDFLLTVDLEYKPTQLTTIWPEVKTDTVSRLKNTIKIGLVASELKRVTKKGKFFLSKENTLEKRICELKIEIESFAHFLQSSC